MKKAKWNGKDVAVKLFRNTDRKGGFEEEVGWSPNGRRIKRNITCPTAGGVRTLDFGSTVECFTYPYIGVCWKLTVRTLDIFYLSMG